MPLSIGIPKTTMATWDSREEGSCLVSTGSDWLQTRSKRVYVRPSYPRIFQECETQWASGIQGIFLLGTPGIGKSCFLDYALHRCLYDGDGQTILYLDGPRGKAFVFRPNCGADIAISEYKLSTVLDDGISTSFDVAFYDPHESSERTNDVHIDIFQGKKFIVPLSPDRENCKKLRKDTRARANLYLGTVSIEEANEMRETCYPNLSADLLRTRYSKIGGIARYLYDMPLAGNVADATSEVVRDQYAALNDITQNPLRIDSGEVASQFKHLWSLYHLQPASTGDGGTNYYEYTIELCCEDARVRIRDMLMNKDVNDLWNLYINTLETHGTLRGIRYEAFAHKKILVHGVNGLAKSLTTTGLGSSTKHISIPAALPRLHLPTNNLGEDFQREVNGARGLPTGGYLLPNNSNFPVVDSLFVSSSETFSLQMKAGRSKPLSGPSAKSIYAATGGCLVFVVPDASIIGKKLVYSEADGPKQWRHYRLVLKHP